MLCKVVTVNVFIICFVFFLQALENKGLNPEEYEFEASTPVSGKVNTSPGTFYFLAYWTIWQQTNS